MKISGRGATINKPGALTHGMPCVIDSFDRGKLYYRVHFDEEWIGYYRREELIVDGIDT